MKYVLMQTSWSPQRKMVTELYLMPAIDIFDIDWPHSTKLSDAMVWDTFDSIANYIEEEEIDDYKIVLIEEEKLFEARLKGT